MMERRKQNCFASAIIAEWEEQDGAGWASSPRLKPCFLANALYGSVALTRFGLRRGRMFRNKCATRFSTNVGRAKIAVLA